MDEMCFIVREPLLDPKQKVLGYELSWQQSDTDAGEPSAMDITELVGFIADQLHDAQSVWMLGEHLVFLQVTPALLASGVLRALPPKSTVLALSAADLSHSEVASQLAALREEGYGIALRDADLALLDKTLLAPFTHIEIALAAGSPAKSWADQAKFCASLTPAPLQVVARAVADWQEYDTCAALGLDAFVGNLYLTTRPGNQPKGLNPAQAMILQLMEMVRQNADVRQLEGILRRDAALSYKLLRYINSVGFGLGAEIQSLRHAVTMLGYSPLYRWLSLLLATASTTGYSPALMQTAIVRGRFAELLGHGFLPKNEAENLFVAGMFSLLDRLLGISMDEVLENIQLSESVAQALLSRDGMYGPFLALAEACEKNNGSVGELADSLFISPRQVNEAHLAALAWAQNLKL